MRVYICIRGTLDWSDPAQVWAQVRDDMWPKMEAWNETFDLPYHEFRRRLAEIASLNHSRVEGAECIPLVQVPPDGLVVPVDDDDWFAPDLVHRLRAAGDPACYGYLWKRQVLEPLRPRRGLLRFIRPWRRSRERYTCASNNYAVVNRPELEPSVLGHRTASTYFDAHPDGVRRIRGTLGIQNRSLGSQTVLAYRRQTITREELLAAFARYRDLYTTWPQPRGCGWATPYIEQMAELMTKIRPR